MVLQVPVLPPDDGEILRYDSAHEDEKLGWHHRHVRFGDDAEIDFQGFVPHVTRFFTEIVELTDTDTDASGDNDDDSRPSNDDA